MPSGVYIRTQYHIDILRKNNSGMLGKKHSQETRKKIGKANSISLKGRKLSDSHRKNIGLSVTEEKSSSWKGNEAGYSTKHAWIRKKLGTPKECENCGITDKHMYHWANISGEYKRDVSDWARLCVSCHSIFDDIAKKCWITRKENGTNKVTQETKEKLRQYMLGRKRGSYKRKGLI